MIKKGKIILVVATLFIAGAIFAYQSYSPSPISQEKSRVFPTSRVAQAATSVPAFPGAEGWGAESVGGRGGRVVEVTNLNDRGEGSLRACAQAGSVPRICVFRVAGIINLELPIRIRNPYITIAGQTAPGDGITLRGGGFFVYTHNVIIRYIHYRGGSNSLITLRPWNDAHDIIVDHCSASGGEDDIFDLNYNTTGATDPEIRNLTIQNCVIAEAHADHPTGLIAGGWGDLSVDPPIIGGSVIHHISVNNNYFVHNGHRNPLIKSHYTEVVNNVVYNWANRIGGAGASAEVDFINNYWKAGPMSNKRPLVFEWFDTEQREHPLASIYIAGNIIPDSQPPISSTFTTTLTDPNQDNWPLFRANEGRFGEQYDGGPVPEDNRRFTPLAPALYPVTIQPALSMFNSVVTDAGSNKRLNGDGTFTDNRDEVDQMFIDEFNNGTGLTSPPTTIRIPSFIDPGTPYIDSDQDGMADEWEILHFGDLTRGSALDSSSDFDGDGYTDLEEFLNGTNPTSAAVIPPPIPEGALIRAIGDIDVYIVKYVGTPSTDSTSSGQAKQFKRLILSPSVFNNYGHLKWEDIKDIDQSTVDSLTTSELVRAVNDDKVYKLFPEGDTGEKRWIKTSDAFTRLGYDWDAVYEINAFDRDSYVTGLPLE